jgi:alpha-glucosidase (family GH31 glycosyl hydrolase)
MSFDLNQVWPNGETVFPDFFKPQTQNWWQECIAAHHESLSFDGLWLVCAFAIVCMLFYQT